MSAAASASLAGRRVLLARDPSRAGAWSAALGARGAIVTARETFELESMAGEALAQRALDRIDEWDWILLTSRNGLRFFERALSARSIRLDALGARFGVVGPQTAQALRESGREPDAVADPPTGFGLAATLRESVAADDRLLIVRPDRGRADLEEGLVELGAEVRAVPFYRNRPAGNLSAVVSAVERGDFDAAVFGSPSSFVHLFGAAGERAVGIFSGLALVAIGPTTAEAIRDLGCAVAAVAVEPTDEGIANAVEAALGR